MSKKEKTIEIEGCAIGEGYPTYLVAELSANHGQDFETAVKLIHAASDAGANAVKLQTYTPDTMTLAANSEPFWVKEGSPWAGKRLYDLYAEAYTPWEWHGELKAIANQRGLALFSSPFDITAVDFLERLEVPAYKIASFELVDIPLLQRVGRTGKPVILSTGMAQFDEIQEAVSTLRGAGCHHIVLLKCTSAYPASPSDMNLRTIPHLAKRFHVPAGLSDHSLGIAVPIAAVALGACFIEKHLTLSRHIPGPDAGFSLEPVEFKAMVDAIRIAEQALGTVDYGPRDGETQSLEHRRSLFVTKALKAGERFTRDAVRSLRPGHGLHPRYQEQILGRLVAKDIPAGTPLGWDLVGQEESHQTDFSVSLNMTATRTS